MWARRGTCIQVYGILKDARARRRRRREKASKARGPRAVRGWGVWWAFGLPEPVWRLLAPVPPGFNGRCPLFEAKTSCRQNWTRSSSAEPGWIKQGLFEIIAFPWSPKYLGSDLESFQRRIYCRVSIFDIPGFGTFFHHLS